MTISRKGSELFIVDNSDQDWKVLKYLHDWCQISGAIDIATGYFEIGSLLALGEEWQKVDRIRILMGDEVSKRTKSAFEEGLRLIRCKLDTSIESEKHKDDFLQGVPAIVEAMRTGRIVCRVYRKEKFHAKAYITHARMEVIGSTALVGSSNFTFPGISENIELNVQITGQPVTVLQDWYEDHWNQAEDVTEDILRTIVRHTREYLPFEVYLKALQEYFRGHELTASEWETSHSRIYPILGQYQKEGYHALLKIAKQHGGALLCDGVGLGKTFIGLMLIERLILYDRKNIALIIPKAARKPVWEQKLKRLLPKLSGVYSNLAIFNHSDLSRGGAYPEMFDSVMERADVIIIDEAHHFRNPGIAGEGERRPSRYRRLFEIAQGKTLFLLTATPINNRLIDLQHMIEIFSRKESAYFKDAPLGIHSLPGHFRKMEKALERLVEAQADSTEGIPETNLAEAERVLYDDALFRALVVQRSRAYVKQSEIQHGESGALFPVREDPQVVPYSVRKTYGRLLDLLEQAFSKANPLVNLAMYYPLAYYKGDRTDIEPLEEGRQKQVVALIRTQFLKRFESSAKAFELSCALLLLRLFAFVRVNSASQKEKEQLAEWENLHSKVLKHATDVLRTPGESKEPRDEYDDIIPEGLLDAIDILPRNEYRVSEIIAQTYPDLDQLVEFLKELRKFRSEHDDKLKALIRMLKNDPALKKNKVIIFTEFMDTAHYLQSELEASGIKTLDEVDSSDDRDRGDVITRFSPYYNESSSTDLKRRGLTETRVLISTDVLSEGLNLQDATFMINYDLHWNPVRLMQRIGRVDRRLDPAIERQIIADHPEQKDIRGKVRYWNFLPPDELDELLRLYAKVSKKTLRISKVFGIEGKKLLKPEDDYQALKDFLHSYEGTPSTLEAMHLEYQKLLQDHPDIAARLNDFPNRVFSGKKHPDADSRGVFFCYALPAPAQVDKDESSQDAEAWTLEAGHTHWYLFDLATEKVIDQPADIIVSIRSTPDTPRHCTIAKQTLSEIRTKIEKHIKNTYLKSAQAPIGVKPLLKAWMELS